MKCPSCDNKLLPGTMNGRRVLACCCGYYRSAQETQDKLPGLDRGIQHRRVNEPEKAIVERIRQRLQREGCTVLRVGQWYANKGGTDKGTPDLFVSPPGEVNRWFGIEVKKPGYSAPEVRPEQRMLAEAGKIVIVTSEIEALEAMQGELSRV